MAKKKSLSSSTEISIRLPELHPGQQMVADCPARFILVVAGRRWGKTTLGIYMVLREALMGGRSWWVAPTYRQGQEAWVPLKRAASEYLKSLCQRIRERDMSIEFTTGGLIEVRSADNPQRMRGAGLSLAVLDEAAQIRAETFYEVILPALIDRNGRALLITTPYGSNWIRDLYEKITKGELANNPEWAAFHFKTTDNPFLPSDSIQSIISAYRAVASSHEVFAQEILGEFVDFSSTPFAEAVRSARADFEPQGPFIMGVDFGGNVDPTGIVIYDAGADGFVYAENLPPGQGLTRLLDEIVLRAEYNSVSLVCAEGNGLGTYLVGELQDRLYRKNIPFVDFWTTHDTKLEILRRLQMAFESGTKIMSGLDELVEQLASYRIISHGGRTVMSAPHGFHDDLVIAAALAYYAASYWNHPIAA